MIKRVTVVGSSKTPHKGGRGWVINHDDYKIDMAACTNRKAYVFDFKTKTIVDLS